MPKPSMVLSVQVVLDVGDIARAATFWGALLDQEPGPPRSKGKFVTVGVLPGTTWLVLQHVPESKTVKNRVHLDLTVADVMPPSTVSLPSAASKCAGCVKVGDISSRWLTLMAMNFAWQRMRGHAQGSACRPSLLLLIPKSVAVGFAGQRVRRTLLAPQHNAGTHAEAVPQHTGHAQTEKTQDRRPAPRYTPPNKGVELTAYSVRSSLAPASSSSSRLAIAIKIRLNKYTLPEPYEPFMERELATNQFRILPIVPRHTAVLTTLPF